MMCFMTALILVSLIALWLLSKPMQVNPIKEFSGKSSTLMVRRCTNTACRFVYPLFVFNASELHGEEAAWRPRCGSQNSTHYAAIFIEKVEVIGGQLLAKSATAIER